MTEVGGGVYIRVSEGSQVIQTSSTSTLPAPQGCGVIRDPPSQQRHFQDSEKAARHLSRDILGENVLCLWLKCKYL